jgi:hypothetical protein
LPCVSIGIEPRALQQWFWPGAAPIFERFVAEGRLARLRDALQALRKLSSGCARIALALGWAIGITLHSFFSTFDPAAVARLVGSFFESAVSPALTRNRTRMFN